MDQPRLSSASKNPEKTPEEDAKKGFTIIEVMIFLAISGLLLLGVLGGTYASIATQRYNDSVRDFAEFLRQTYGEVISPESLGAANGDFGGNSDTKAIYGKVIVFGLDKNSTSDVNPSTVYTATLVGDTTIPTGSDGFLDELEDVKARLFCGVSDAAGNVINDTTVDAYTPLWESRIVVPGGGLNDVLEGTVIIARSPTSGTVHTAFKDNFTPDLANQCSPSGGNGASSALNSEIKNFDMTSDVNFCIKSDQSKIVRDVLLTADGHNNTAINLLDDADARNICR